MNSNLSIGDRAVDKEKNETVIIISLTGERADEVEVKSQNKTIAELNPSYPEDDMVVEVVFESSLSSRIPRWPFKNSKTLPQSVNDQKVKTYSYPVSRLKRINSAFVKGVTLRVAGVADPIKQKSGSYYYEVISEGEKIFSQENTIGTNFTYVDKKIATYSGIISGLMWVIRNQPDYVGVVIETEDRDVYKQINYGNEIKDEELKQLSDRMTEQKEKLPYCTIKYVDRQDHREVIENAIAAFKKQKNSI